MENNKNIWGVHCDLGNLFIEKSIIAIGWDDIGDLSNIENGKEKFKQFYKKIHQEASKNSVSNIASKLYKFVYEIKIGDYVVYPNKNDKNIYIGEIIGNYYYDNNAYSYKHRREVKWLKNMPRSYFSQGALYEVGSFSSLFQIKNYPDDFLKVLSSRFNKNEIVDEEDNTVEEAAETVIQNTKDYVLRELRHHYKGYDLENVVDSLLRAMGYKTIKSPHGGDRGKDIIAFRDELPPRIMVQVKSQDDKIPETLVQALKGAMSEGDYGLFVALSDYSDNAKLFLQQNPKIKGLNGDEFVDLLLKYYEKMDDEFKDNIKLQITYLPVK